MLELDDLVAQVAAASGWSADRALKNLVEIAAAAFDSIDELRYYIDAIHSQSILAGRAKTPAWIVASLLAVLELSETRHGRDGCTRLILATTPLKVEAIH